VCCVGKHVWQRNSFFNMTEQLFSLGSTFRRSIMKNRFSVNLWRDNCSHLNTQKPHRTPFQLKTPTFRLVLFGTISSGTRHDRKCNLIVYYVSCKLMQPVSFPICTKYLFKLVSNIKHSFPSRLTWFKYIQIYVPKRLAQFDGRLKHEFVLFKWG
jgi:hypothetical protein